MDLTPVAHLAALKGKLTFINFFDGFHTSHENQKIDAWDYGTLKDMPAIVEAYMHVTNEKISTDYGLFNYYGAGGFGEGADRGELGGATGV